MTADEIKTTVAVAALIFSAVSLLLSYLSYARSRRSQIYDYAPRLQIEEEQEAFGSPANKHFEYKAGIKNKGIKPLLVRRLGIRYGESGEGGRKTFHVLQNGFTMSPGETRGIVYSMSETDINNAMTELAIQDCVFRLVMEYEDANGDIQTTERELGGYKLSGEMAVLFYARPEMLT